MISGFLVDECFLAFASLIGRNGIWACVEAACFAFNVRPYQGNSSVFPGHTSGKLLFGDVRQGLRPWHVDVERAGFKIAHGSFTQTHLISIILKPKTYPCTCVLRPLEGCDNGIHSPRIALICAIELLLLALLLLKVPPGSLQFTRQTFVLSWQLLRSQGIVFHEDENWCGNISQAVACFVASFVEKLERVRWSKAYIFWWEACDDLISARPEITAKFFIAGHFGMGWSRQRSKNQI